MEILNQFGVQPVLLLAQVVNFLILLFILKRFLYKPILQALEKRKELIVKTLKNAEESEKIYAEAKEKSDRIITNASEQSRKILDESNKVAAQIVDGATKKVAEILQAAQKEASKLVDIERVKLNQALKEHIGELVVVTYEKVNGKKLTEKQRKDIVEMKNLS